MISSLKVLRKNVDDRPLSVRDPPAGRVGLWYGDEVGDRVLAFRDVFFTDHTPSRPWQIPRASESSIHCNRIPYRHDKPSLSHFPHRGRISKHGREKSMDIVGRKRCIFGILTITLDTPVPASPAAGPGPRHLRTGTSAPSLRRSSWDAYDLHYDDPTWQQESLPRTIRRKFGRSRCTTDPERNVSGHWTPPWPEPTCKVGAHYIEGQEKRGKQYPQ